ncbi:hypothetical protein [Haloprofundus salilacus]|uniref:hypothetical protein n=1 Tax=Haloprofundus salilacus TaxID=2876190 RepID=UPI001CCB36F6|nr:hypothetical protein [Haloprofundus salilacus]
MYGPLTSKKEPVIIDFAGKSDRLDAILEERKRVTQFGPPDRLFGDISLHLFVGFVFQPRDDVRGPITLLTLYRLGFNGHRLAVAGQFDDTLGRYQRQRVPTDSNRAARPVLFS